MAALVLQGTWSLRPRQAFHGTVPPCSLVGCRCLHPLVFDSCPPRETGWDQMSWREGVAWAPFLLTLALPQAAVSPAVSIKSPFFEIKTNVPAIAALPGVSSVSCLH